MKAVFPRSLVLVAGVALVVTLAAVALLVGARAVAGAESAQHRLLLVALMVGGALYSVVRGSGDDKEDTAEVYSLHVTRVGAHNGIRAFMKTHEH